MLDLMLGEILAWRGDGLICVLFVAVIVFLGTCARKTARRCPRCKELNRPHARFCAHCGQRL